MELLIAISDSESNILAGHSAGAWGFKLKKNRKDEYIEILLKEEHRSIVGNFITFWSSEKGNDNSQGFIGLGIITENQIPGKIIRNIWLDNDYYGELPFKLISSKKMLIDNVREIYGKKWNRRFAVISGNMPKANLTDEELQKFIIYMLT